MNFLEKLDYLMNLNNLNKSTLSKACDIPYTTIDNWYKRGYDGLKLTTLRKLSEYFEISLDFWANDKLPIENLNYSNIEKEIINQYRKQPDMQYAVRKLLGVKTKESE